LSFHSPEKFGFCPMALTDKKARAIIKTKFFMLDSFLMGLY